MNKDLLDTLVDALTHGMKDNSVKALLNKECDTMILTVRGKPQVANVMKILDEHKTRILSMEGI